jgi:hypothetical protein
VRKIYSILFLAAFCLVVLSMVGCGGGGGSNAHGSQAPVPTAIVSVAPQVITSGQSATLTWTTTNGTAATLSEDLGSTTSAQHRENRISVLKGERGITVHIREPRLDQQSGATIALNGSMAVNPTETTTYTISVSGAGGTAQAQATLHVQAAPPTQPVTANITVSPQSISAGQQAAVSWQTTNATAATLNGESVALNGSMTVSPTVTTAYALVATGPGGTAASQATLQVSATPPPQPVTATLAITPQSITAGQSATLSWQTSNAAAASLNGQTVALNGSMTVSPTVTTAYTLVATGPGGAAQSQATLQVSGAPPMSADALVKTYNINPIGAESHGETMRWLNGTVGVYDSTGFSGLQSALDVWNGAIGGPVTLVISTNPSSPITISFDSSVGTSGDCGVASPGIHTGTGGDNSIYASIIRINPSCGSNLTVYRHELGHAVGFFAHTSDGGLMDPNAGNGQLTGEDTIMIHHLYELPVGTLIP